MLLEEIACCQILLQELHFHVGLFTWVVSFVLHNFRKQFPIWLKLIFLLCYISWIVGCIGSCYLLTTAVNFEPRGKSISKGILVAIVLAAVACAVTIFATATIFITKKHYTDPCKLSRKHTCKFSKLITWVFLLINTSSLTVHGE